MPYQGLEDGLHLISQQSKEKGVKHWGILDVGNRLRHPQVVGQQPFVIHQTPPSLRFDPLQVTGAWKWEGRIVDEQGAIRRIHEAARTPNYNLFVNNCEHFALGAATGTRESPQIQAVTIIAGLAALALIAMRE